MELEKIKNNIKQYFVEINHDKFTKVKTVKCKHKIVWKDKAIENKFMLTKRFNADKLSMEIDYRHKDEIDSVFFTFTYTSDDGYPGMTNIKMYLILDDNTNIELSESSGFENMSSPVSNSITLYIETAQLAVSMSDFIAIVNAKKIEYSIRFGKGALEDTFKNSDLVLLKGFYNSTFDEDFETIELNNFINDLGNLEEDIHLKELILSEYKRDGKLAAAKLYQEVTGESLANASKYVSKFESQAKSELSNLYNDPIERHFLVEDNFKKSILNKEDSINSIKLDTGMLSYWKNNLYDQLLVDEIKIGIKDNPSNKSPRILIYPVAFVYSDMKRLYQVNYKNIKSIEIKKGFINNTVTITDDSFIHRIDFFERDLANFFVSFLQSELTKNDSEAEYLINENNSEQNLNNGISSLISRYNISESDLHRLIEIENEKSQLGLFSLKKESLKSESLKILKPYNIKFMDLGNLLNEIKKSS